MAEIAILAVAVGAFGGLSGAYAAASPDAFGVSEKNISDSAGASAFFCCSPEKSVSVIFLLAAQKKNLFFLH
jgi:hypothetical protein